MATPGKWVLVLGSVLMLEISDYEQITVQSINQSINQSYIFRVAQVEKSTARSTECPRNSQEMI